MVDEKKVMKGEKKDKSKKDKSKKEKVVAPVVESVVAPVVESVVESEETETIVVSDSVMETESGVMDEVKETEFDVMFKEMDKLRISTALYFKEQRTMMKKVEKEYMKMYKRCNRKKKKSNGENIGGLAKPQKISEQLCEFLGVPAGTEKSYQEVLKGVHGYIKEQKLKNPNNGKEVLPDEKLEKLLQSNGEPVYYFENLHKLLGPHYLKDEPTK
jgi:chromatin remodeling complex protein RSC6